MTVGPILGGNPRLKFDSGLNIVCDGNSLVAGQGGAQNYPRVLAKTAPVALYTRLTPDATALAGSPTNKWQTDKGVIVTNLGINGQTWRQMNGLSGGSAADVDGAWVGGKVNVLICWEGTNAICNTGRTAAQAFQDAADYIAARQAVHPWIVLIGTCLPRQSGAGQATTTAQNAVLDSYNAQLRIGYLGIGAKGLFDVRQVGSAFAFADYNDATFETAAADSAGLWASGETGAHTHLSSNGYIYLVNNFIAPAIRRLPVR